MSVCFGQKAGTFFNEVPSGNDKDKKNNRDLNEDLTDLLQRRKRPSLATAPSTVNGVPTSRATGFGKSSKPATKASKPYIAVGEQSRAVNHPSKSEFDDQGYTLYQDTETGEKSRVFEALVEYPTLFKIKIVGLNEGLFVEEMVALVAESCNVADVSEIQHSVKLTGKWSSITVNAPVQSAAMLYALYENVDRDPRVKFKF
jgi:putative lipoic acid-binding regulatory protein